MSQFEYGDFYKFVVSLGIALIIASVALFWIILREPFDLLVEASKLPALTEAGRAIVLRRQETIAWVLPYAEIASVTIAFVGLAMVVVGLWKWYPRQLLRDRREDLDLERDLRPEEVQDKAERDTLGDEEVQSPFGKTASASPSAKAYIRVEGLLYKKFAECLDSEYMIKMNKKFGDTNYDFILRSRLDGEPDRVIEIKYLQRGGFSPGWLRRAGNYVAIAADLYSSTASRKAIPMLLLVLATPEGLAVNSVVRMWDLASEDLRRQFPKLRSSTLRNPISST